MKKYYWLGLLICLVAKVYPGFAGEIEEKSVVQNQVKKKWETFPLRNVRLQPGSPFYQAMKVDQQFMLGADPELMLNMERRRAGLSLVTTAYPGSSQPVGTRPLYLSHYLSAISLMYAQTGDTAFLDRSNYIVREWTRCEDRMDERRKAGDTTVDRRISNAYKNILSGRLELNGGDEFNFPWGGLNGMGNMYYSMHKDFAALRDAFLYCNNKSALGLLKRLAEPTVQFVLKANPDLFDDMLDVEHGGMNEVFADLYAVTGDKRYLQVSVKFNHQKVILNTAAGNDVLTGRHANMQVPTFVGTARQYQLTGNEIYNRATENFFELVLDKYSSAIGGNSRYERFGLPGAVSQTLGYTANETCNTYNMLKVALQAFQTTGRQKYMNYFEKALYNDILASLDLESGGFTYYMSLMPGGFKAFSNVYDLTGVWCCVGTGMENHSKYGEAVFFHNNNDLFLNLFIGARLKWQEKGLELSVSTRFPENDTVSILIEKNNAFTGNICIRRPDWTGKRMTVKINGNTVQAAVDENGNVVLKKSWKRNDRIQIVFQPFAHVEMAQDDDHYGAIFYGPVLLAGQLGKEKMPGTDLVRHAHMVYRDWIPPVDDIPVIVADPVAIRNWTIATDKPLVFNITKVAKLHGEPAAIRLIPFYQLRHERQNVYWKIFSSSEWVRRNSIVSDEINIGDAADEKAHALKGMYTDTTRYKDKSNFWENNRIGRFARDSGWFGYRLKINKNTAKQFLIIRRWGGETQPSGLKVFLESQLLTRINDSSPVPLSFYDQVYEIPSALIVGKEAAEVSFKALPGMPTGKCYAIQVTSDPAAFTAGLFY